MNNIKDKALNFAINAHNGQVRKNEPEKPMIIHPISVGRILEEYECDDNVIASGYLHDVIEDTKYTSDDILKEFGEDVLNLVMTASEPDKSLSWEERKQHTIDTIKNVPLRNKMVITADKINNLEDLNIKFKKEGKKDFSRFKRGEEQQKWYYTSVYESLINNENENLPIFKRLKTAIDNVFYEKENDKLNNIFKDDLEHLEKLKKLHAEKEELIRLKRLCIDSKPFVIEFSGTPRTGKTTTILLLEEFLRKAGFKVSILEEFTTSSYYKKNIKSKRKDYTFEEYHIVIIEEVIKQLEKELKEDNDVIIIDRSINDRLIWNNRCLNKNMMTQKIHDELKEKITKLSKEYIDYLVITTANPETSIRRDYYSSLCLEERSFINEQNINEYNDAVNNLKDIFNEYRYFKLMDNTSIDLTTSSIEIISDILPAMKEQYVKQLKKDYSHKS